MSGEASISGARTDNARGSSGVSGAACRDRGRVNWGDPARPLPKGSEETLSIRQSRNLRESGRESDGAIVLLIWETT